MLNVLRNSMNCTNKDFDFCGVCASVIKNKILKTLFKLRENHNNLIDLSKIQILKNKIFLFFPSSLYLRIKLELL
jgi:hypothetical protein